MSIGYCTGEMDFSSDEDRTATYDFNDLDGIIFGIKTPSDTKLELFKIIEESAAPRTGQTLNSTKLIAPARQGRSSMRS